MLKSAHIIVALTMTLASFGCATSDSGTASADESNCFKISGIRSWRAIDTEHLYIESFGEDKKFLFTLATSCQGIDTTRELWFSRRSGYLCANNLGDVIFRDGVISNACVISQIEKVVSEDHANGLVRKRKLGQ
jgi:hypothetical protein